MHCAMLYGRGCSCNRKRGMFNEGIVLHHPGALCHVTREHCVTSPGCIVLHHPRPLFCITREHCGHSVHKETLCCIHPCTLQLLCKRGHYVTIARNTCGHYVHEDIVSHNNGLLWINIYSLDIFYCAKPYLFRGLLRKLRVVLLPQI